MRTHLSWLSVVMALISVGLVTLVGVALAAFVWSQPVRQWWQARSPLSVADSVVAIVPPASINQSSQTSREQADKRAVTAGTGATPLPRPTSSTPTPTPRSTGESTPRSTPTPTPRSTGESTPRSTLAPAPSPALAPTRDGAPIRFIFVGDMMFDRQIRVNAQKRGGYALLLSPQLRQLLAQADVVVGNLEGPVTDNTSQSVGSAVGSPANYLFTFSPQVLPFLYDANIRVVSLGNNHVLNFGQAGLDQTYQLLQEHQISSFGATGSRAHQSRWLSLTIGQSRVAFVNYNQFVAQGYDQALQDLAAARPDHQLVVLYTHWGNEYVPENKTLREQARAFVAAGADLIIGSHPHVVTGTDVIEGTKVYYSLGNFIFDQYFEPAVRSGLVVEAAYEPTTQQFRFTDYAVTLHPNGTTSLTDEGL